jgi:penicillin-binding protein 2
MNRYCKAFGLGEPTGVEIREGTGILAGPEYYESKGLQWREVDTVMAAIGQSDNMFNPLQMSNYIATVLNGGTRYSVHLLREVREYGEKQPSFVSKTEVVDKIYLSGEALGAVRDGMKQMIQHDSVASKFMSGLPVTVGGKTGTAQRGTGRNDNRFFVCAAPYNDPEIVVTVIIEPDDEKPKDGVHGSVYASYAASEVLKEYYNKK